MHEKNHYEGNVKDTPIKPKRSVLSKVLDIIGIVVCVLLVPILVINMTLVIQSFLEPNVPPNFLGHTPLVVGSGSMSPTFNADDLVIVGKADDATTLEAGTVICYQTGSVLITHRIIAVEQAEDGSVMYVTQGDANNTPDTLRVEPSQVIGVYERHIADIGWFLIFLQSPVGMICCVIIPLLILFIIYYVNDRMKYKALLKQAEALQSQATE